MCATNFNFSLWLKKKGQLSPHSHCGYLNYSDPVTDGLQIPLLVLSEFKQIN